MNSTDDLRTRFQRCLDSVIAREASDEDEELAIDRFHKMLADPALQRAIFDAMGLEVLGGVGDVYPDRRIVVRPRGDAS